MSRTDCDFVLIYNELMVTKDEKEAFSKRFIAILDKANIPRKGKGRLRVLAKMFNVSDKGARKWIEGEAIPGIEKLIEIVAKLNETGVTVEWLLTENPAYAPERIQESNPGYTLSQCDRPPIIEESDWNALPPLIRALIEVIINKAKSERLTNSRAQIVLNAIEEMCGD